MRSEAGSNPRPVSRQQELHGEQVTLTRYRYTAPHHGKYKQWEAEFIANDVNHTVGRVEIWPEHMRLLKQAMGYWKPGESVDWQPFPQEIEAILEVTQRGMRIKTVLGILEGAAV